MRAQRMVLLHYWICVFAIHFFQYLKKISRKHVSTCNCYMAIKNVITFLEEKPSRIRALTTLFTSVHALYGFSSDCKGFGEGSKDSIIQFWTLWNPCKHLPLNWTGMKFYLYNSTELLNIQTMPMITFGRTHPNPENPTLCSPQGCGKQFPSWEKCQSFIFKIVKVIKWLWK